MNVMVIGKGGREHALGWKLAQSDQCDRVFFLPGNAGTAEVGENVRLPLDPVNTKTIDDIARSCRDNAIELVVIGPEDLLWAGLSDGLRQRGLRVFGPSKEASQLEADKAWAKQLMRSAAVPTAEAKIFAEPDAALSYVRAHETPVVVKAAGLAQGKGVIVCDGPEEAADAVQRIMIDREFGDAGERVVVEERLVGEEASILALVSGRDLYVLESAQDHKRAGEGDTGPNTGGMGAFTPTPRVDDALMERIERQILVPTVDALRREGIEYQGVLYAGLILTAGGPKVLEFNCRFGDPECQPLMTRYRGDLLQAMLAVCDDRLDQVEIDWDPRPACCVVMCSGGYPGRYEKGAKIDGLEKAKQMPDVELFHAGTAQKDDDVVTDGGRVLNVVALGSDVAEARDRANAACDQIHFRGGFFRRDIGGRAPSGSAPPPDGNRAS